MFFSPVINPQIPPIQQITQPFRSIPLYNPLATCQPRKIIHILRQLSNWILQWDKTTIHNVNTIRHGIGNVLLHETTETWEVGGDAGYTHDSAFGGGVTPGFVVAGKDAQVATAHKFLVVETEQGIGGA